MDPNDQNQQGPADDSTQGDAAGVGGGSDDAPAGGSQPRQERQGNDGSAASTYPQERFDENKAKWRDLILGKKKTPAQIIATVESKGVLMTEAQKNTIDSWSHEND
mgnify:CR=1 FL=1